MTAVDRLDLTVCRGEVYGLLGPNGAGKTTTLRMLLGLVRPTSGSGEILGTKIGAPKALERVGARVETPGFYPHLSGRANLRVLATLARATRDGVDAALSEVDLLDRADDRFGAYSMGMKQRLGVAAALLKDPDLLVLDEPTNGLDPQARADMRSLVRSLGRGRRTVVLSSHLLEDVEQVCDRVGVMRLGRLIAETTVEDLRGPRSLLVRAEPVEQAARILRAIATEASVRRDGDALIVDGGTAEPGDVARRLVGAGLRLEELRPVQRSLETAFLELIAAEDEPVREEVA